VSRAGVQPAIGAAAFAAHQAQRPITFVEKTFLPQLAYETEGAHHGTSAAAASSEALRYSLRRAKKILGKQGREQDLEHPLAEIGEQVRRIGRRSFRRCAGGRCGVKFFETGPDEVPEAFAVEDADCESGANLERNLTRLFAALGEIAGAPTTASGAAGSGNALA